MSSYADATFRFFSFNPRTTSGRVAYGYPDLANLWQLAKNFNRAYNDIPDPWAILKNYQSTPVEESPSHPLLKSLKDLSSYLDLFEENHQSSHLQGLAVAYLVTSIEEPEALKSLGLQMRLINMNSVFGYVDFDELQKDYLNDGLEGIHLAASRQIRQRLLPIVVR